MLTHVSSGTHKIDKIPDDEVKRDRRLFRRDMFDMLEYVASEKQRNKMRDAVEKILDTSVTMEQLLAALNEVKTGAASAGENDLEVDE